MKKFFVVLPLLFFSVFSLVRAGQVRADCCKEFNCCGKASCNADTKCTYSCRKDANDCYKWWCEPNCPDGYTEGDCPAGETCDTKRMFCSDCNNVGKNCYKVLKPPKCDSSCPGICAWRDGDNACHEGQMPTPYNTWCCHRECKDCSCRTVSGEGANDDRCPPGKEWINCCPSGTPTPTPTLALTLTPTPTLPVTPTPTPTSTSTPTPTGTLSLTPTSTPTLVLCNSSCSVEDKKSCGKYTCTLVETGRDRASGRCRNGDCPEDGDCICVPTCVSLSSQKLINRVTNAWANTDLSNLSVGDTLRFIVSYSSGEIEGAAVRIFKNGVVERTHTTSYVGDGVPWTSPEYQITAEGQYQVVGYILSVGVWR